MLQVPSEFPNIGCTAFVRGTAEEVRILQRNRDGSCLVQRLGPIPRSQGASVQRRVDSADLFATGPEALGKPDRRRKGAARGRR